ncbi:class E sortase [Streptomyces sp. NPDC048629]|uniref:class E sortase n=1 Tax=Streptomyces sp. NPDC048629 TaxID=3154824 RepID=UPI003447E9B8
MHRTHTVPLALAALAAGLVAGCSATGDGRAADTSKSLVGTASVVSTAPSEPSGPSAPSAPPTPSSGAPAAVPAPPHPATAPSPTPSPTRQPRVADLDIPSIGVADLRVVPYEGTTDDRPGTRIQDRGEAASPYGEHGGVGPGEVGNYLVTAHRLSAGGPLHDLPSLKDGDTVVVTAGGTVYTYEIVSTRKTSFRDPRSLAAQRAEVPGKPGEKATRAMITLSTCATPEDNAAGNFWRDAQGNPEHRIDKIGVLVSSRPV